MNKKLVFFLIAVVSAISSNNIKAADSRVPQLSEIHRGQLNEIYEKAAKIITINTEYCNKNQYEKFRKILKNPPDKAKISESRMREITDAYKIPEPKIEPLEKEPNEIQCISAIEGIYALLEEYYPIIEPIYWSYKEIPLLSEADKKQINELLEKLSKEHEIIDLSNCVLTYPKFSERYEKLANSSIANHLDKIIKLYELPNPPTKLIGKPAKEPECFVEMDKVEVLYKQYTPLIERLYKDISAEMLENY